MQVLADDLAWSCMTRIRKLRFEEIRPSRCPTIQERAKSSLSGCRLIHSIPPASSFPAGIGADAAFSGVTLIYRKEITTLDRVGTE